MTTKTQTKIVNATIEHAALMIEDHGILTISIEVGGDGWGQGFGGYCLFTGGCKEKPTGIDATGYFIWRLFETLEVNSWKDLKGKVVRIKQDHSKIHAIGHPVKNLWFNPSDEFEGLNRKLGNK